MLEDIDKEITALHEEIRALLVSYERKKLQNSQSLPPPANIVEEDKNKMSSQQSFPKRTIPIFTKSSSTPFMTEDDFKYLEYDDNGKLVAFLTKVKKAKEFRSGDIIK